jgi:hypothetical protein
MIPESGFNALGGGHKLGQAGRTICAHGEAVAWPVQSAVPKFKDEYLDSIRRRQKGEACLHLS